MCAVGSKIIVQLRAFLLVGVNNLLSGRLVSVQTDYYSYDLCSVNWRRGYEEGKGMSVLRS